MAYQFAGRYGPAAILDDSGNPQPSLSVTVYLADGTTAAVLFTDRTRATTTSNTVSTDVHGVLSFFADPGRYVLGFNVGGTRSLAVTVDPDPASDTPMLNVLDYGAKGDGTTDDKTAIQAALNAIPAAGGTLFFPAGTYLSSAALTVNAGTTITGPGIIQRTGSNATKLLSIGTANVTLRDITIDGARGASTATADPCVMVLGCDNFHAANVTFRNCPTNNPALQLQGTTNSTVTGCTFKTVGYGVIVGLGQTDTYTCRNNTVVGNTIDTCDLNGVFVTSNIGSVAGTVNYTVYGTTVTGNTIRGCGDTAIESGSGSVNSVIAASSIIVPALANTTGILVRDNRGTTVTGNTVTGTGAASSTGISVVGLNDITINLTVTGNLMTAHLDGMKIVNVDQATVSGNLSASNGSRGFYTNSALQSTFVGNVAYANAADGFEIGVYNTPGSAVTDCTFVGNTAANNLNGFVTQSGASHCVFTGNVATDTRSTGKTQQRGLYLFAGSNFTVGLDNLLYGNATDNFLNNVASTSMGPAFETITGAKGSNAALGSLIGALSNLGLVVDSTTA